MSRIDEVRSYYEQFDWRYRGDYWATRWGSSEMQWYCSILPRIAAFLPAATVLEIGAGPGRLSAFLLQQAERLILTDLVEPCVSRCTERFRDYPQVSCHLTDGQSLPPIEPASVSFVFSFYSLVHADPETISAYLRHIARVLAPDGIAFLHHSNAGSFDPQDKAALRTFNDRDTAARDVVAFAREAGLWVRSQELFSWEGDAYLTDCFSVILNPNGPGHTRPITVNNWEFGQEAERAKIFAEIYEM
ncbi:MAG: methyltransferase domain-containing protein [Alphaproteobacteria bacterium]|nr:methyltransferase domain-containing protein [Alphaproteobacteria bacterium]